MWLAYALGWAENSTNQGITLPPRRWVDVCQYINPYTLKYCIKLESSQSLHTSAKAMLFAGWQHHLRFCSGFPYAPLKAMVMKISKWSRIQDSYWITPKIESLVDFAIPDIPSKYQKDPSITFWVILLTDRQTNKQSGKNITSLAEVTKIGQLNTMLT